LRRERVILCKTLRRGWRVSAKRGRAGGEKVGLYAEENGRKVRLEAEFFCKTG
jgi:hypothetical protein